MRKTGSKGYTIMEVITVIGIVGLLASLSSMGMDMVRRERVAGTARELLADIQAARYAAMTQEGKGFGIRFESPSSYVLFHFNDCNEDYTYDTDSCGGGREESNAVRKTLSPSIALSKTNPWKNLHNEVIIFDKFGSPRRSNWAMGMMTVLIRDRNYGGPVKCIAISLTRVREKRWNGSACVWE